MKIVILARAGSFLFLLAPMPVSAQIPDGRNEPRHKIVMENEYVRLLDGLVPVMDTTLTHTHSENSVVLFLTNSTFGLKNVDERPVVAEVRPGEAVYRAYGDKSVTHKVWNQSATVFHFMVVELLKRHSANDTCTILPQPIWKLQWQNKLVRVYKFEIGRGNKYKLSKSNCAYLMIDVSGTIIATSSGNSSSLNANGFAFFPPQSDIEIRGNNKYSQCVLLELK